MNTMINDLSRGGWLQANGKPVLICSQNITVEQGARIFLNFVDKYPQTLGGFASDAFFASLLEIYFCDKHPWTR